MSAATVSVNFDTAWDEPTGIQELSEFELEAVTGGYLLLLAVFAAGVAVGVYLQT